MKLPAAFSRFISSAWFLRYSPYVLWTIAPAGFGLLFIGMFWGLAIAPTDALQGHSYRLLYIHVPAAFIAQSLYVCCGLASIFILLWRIKLAGNFLVAAVPLGVVLSILVLITGAVWGKETWGTYWLWNDPRLLSSGLLLLLYLGLLAVRNAIDDQEIADRACAILALVGLANLPIIRYSVYWWNSIHQKSSISLGGNELHPSILAPLLLMIVATFLVSSSIVLWRMRSDILDRKLTERMANDV